MTREEKNKRQREYRKASNNVHIKRYEKTPRGFLMRAYRNMKSRVEGIQWRKAHLYAGKELLSKDEFYVWAWNNKDFHRLFGLWQKSGYARTLTPSVDRIDSTRGYSIDNMRWITHSLNSALGTRARNSARQAIYKAAGVTK